MHVKLPSPAGPDARVHCGAAALLEPTEAHGPQTALVGLDEIGDASTRTRQPASGTRP